MCFVRLSMRMTSYHPRCSGKVERVRYLAHHTSLHVHVRARTTCIRRLLRASRSVDPGVSSGSWEIRPSLCTEGKSRSSSCKKRSQLSRSVCSVLFLVCLLLLCAELSSEACVRLSKNRMLSPVVLKRVCGAACRTAWLRIPPSLSPSICHFLSVPERASESTRIEMERELIY